MRLFAFSETWGPFCCEHTGCRKRTFCIQITDADNETLPEQTGPQAANFILRNQLGEAVCEEHQSSECKA